MPKWQFFTNKLNKPRILGFEKLLKTSKKRNIYKKDKIDFETAHL